VEITYLTKKRKKNNWSGDFGTKLNLIHPSLVDLENKKKVVTTVVWQGESEWFNYALNILSVSYFGGYIFSLNYYVPLTHHNVSGICIIMTLIGGVKFCYFIF